MCHIFGSNRCCSRNRDKENCHAHVVKGLIIKKGVVDSETKNFLIVEFYRQGFQSILISNNPLGPGYCLSVNLERFKF